MRTGVTEKQVRMEFRKQGDDFEFGKNDAVPCISIIIYSVMDGKDSGIRRVWKLQNDRGVRKR